MRALCPSPPRFELTSHAKLWQFVVLLKIGEHREACEEKGRQIMQGVDLKPLPLDCSENLRIYLMGDRRDEATRHLDEQSKAYTKRRRVALPIDAKPTLEEIESGAHYVTGEQVPFTPADLGHNGLPVDCSFLYPAQDEAVHKLMACVDKNNFLLIGTPGTGKTAVILALQAMQPLALPMLVVAPSHLIPNWISEHEKYASKLLLKAPYTDIENGAVVKEWLQESGMLIVSQNKYRKHCLELARDWKFTIVIDEAHDGMGAQGSRLLDFHKSVLKVQRGRTIAMTGTPIRKGLKTNLMQFLKLYFHADVRALEAGWFDHVWRMMVSEDDCKRALGAKILQNKFSEKMFIMPTVGGPKQYAIRKYRIHADIDLPESTDDSFFVRHEAALQATQDRRVRVVKTLVDMYGDERGIILFVTRKEIVDKLRAVIPEAFVYMGDTSDKDKADFLDYFSRREPSGKVGIMMAKMAVGVTLSVGANVAVMVQPLFSASDQAQAWGRIDRIGQEEQSVHFIELCMTRVEYGMSKLCDSKQDQADALNGKKSSEDAKLLQKIQSLSEQPEDGKFLGNMVLDQGTDGLRLSVYEKPGDRNRNKKLNPREIALCAANEERRLTQASKFQDRTVDRGIDAPIEVYYTGLKYDQEQKVLQFELVGNRAFLRIAYRYVKGSDLVYDEDGALSGKRGELDGDTEKIGKSYWTVIHPETQPNGDQISACFRRVNIRWGGPKVVVVARVQGSDGTWSAESYPIMYWWASPSRGLG